MITEELRKYIDMVNEEWENDLLLEMARITDKLHGIENVVIWVGMANKRRGLRIKVSNIPNKMDPNDTFVIQMPSLDYDPSQVARWIKQDTMKRILEWIKLNQQLLYDYELGNIMDTSDFLSGIAKV